MSDKRSIYLTCDDCGTSWTQDWEEPNECPKCGTDDEDSEEEGEGFYDGSDVDGDGDYGDSAREWGGMDSDRTY